MCNDVLSVLCRRWRSCCGGGVVSECLYVRIYIVCDDFICSFKLKDPIRRTLVRSHARTDTRTEIQTDRQTDRHTDTDTDTHTHRHTHTHTHTHTPLGNKIFFKTIHCFQTTTVVPVLRIPYKLGENRSRCSIIASGEMRIASTVCPSS